MQSGRCQDDYIELYDGPPHSSPLLGRLCSGFFPTYVSSSNMMTIRFHSDSRYTFRGFQAHYSSIPADHNTTLQCLPDYMHAVVSRDYLQSQGYSAQMVTLNDSRCKPTVTSQEVIFNIPYNGCGTMREENNDTINYSNMIKFRSSGSIIKRKKDIHLHISCKMLQKTWIQIMYVAEDTVDVHENQFGRYDVNITFYDSSSFLHQVHDFPYYIDLNQNLYLQVYLHSSDPNLVVFVEACMASPDPHDFSTLTYNILENGCGDSSYATYSFPDSHFARFKFNAFEFISRHPLVYLQCELVVCRLRDYSSRCYQGCISRSKRDTSPAEEKVNVVVGPLQLREGGAQSRNTVSDPQLRLVSGGDRCSGRVEVYHAGKWGTVCDDLFGMNSGSVVCRQLDCGQVVSVLGWSYFGPGKEDIHLDDVQCRGTESYLWDCQHAGWNRHNCGHNEDVGVICSGKKKTLRLADGDGKCSGRVELYHNGSWGTVCDDAWELADAKVVCRRLGCGEALLAVSEAQFGPGSGNILLDDVQCRGDEADLWECSHRGIAVHNCQHKEDASVICAVFQRFYTLTGNTCAVVEPASLQPLCHGKWWSMDKAHPGGGHSMSLK
nr:PREDICTED: deleted in malignant brain tumors 1 protein [Balearica regulorum gibbericeps]